MAKRKAFTGVSELMGSSNSATSSSSSPSLTPINASFSLSPRRAILEVQPLLRRRSSLPAKFKLNSTFLSERSKKLAEFTKLATESGKGNFKLGAGDVTLSNSDGSTSASVPNNKDQQRKEANKLLAGGFAEAGLGLISGLQQVKSDESKALEQIALGVQNDAIRNRIKAQQIEQSALDRAISTLDAIDKQQLAGGNQAQQFIRDPVTGRLL